MPSSIEALAIILFALLPGGLYVWAFERQVGHWGVSLADRTMRFIGASAILHALAAPLTYHLWRTELADGLSTGGPALPLWLWPVLLAYLAVPMALGSVIGYGTKSGNRLAGFIAGSNAAPTAWDYVFSPSPNAWVRCRLKTGKWIGGAFAKGSYVGGHPEPADLYLSRAAEVIPETGAFSLEKGKPKFRDGGILVRWDEVEYLELIER